MLSKILVLLSTQSAKSEGEIPNNCESWFDGCNSCRVENGQLTFCTEMACSENYDPYCSSYSGSPDQNIPDGCHNWFDGCNMCMRDYGPDGAGDGAFCTEKYCESYERPECRDDYENKSRWLAFTTITLVICGVLVC